MLYSYDEKRHGKERKIYHFKYKKIIIITEVDYWIGGKYEAGSSWHWESGELMNQSVFRDGAPNNAVPHYCTTLDYKPSSYAFMNADCLTLKMYVCEHN